MKVGDRVAVYGFFACHLGGVGVMLNGAKGRILHDNGDRGLTVFLDEPLKELNVAEVDRRTIDTVHPRQVRRLSKQRRIWVPIGYMTTAALHWCGGGSFGQLLKFLQDKPGTILKPDSSQGSNYQYLEFIEVGRKR